MEEHSIDSASSNANSFTQIDKSKFVRLMKSNYHIKQIEAMNDYLNGLQSKATEINELAELNYHTLYPVYD